ATDPTCTLSLHDALPIYEQDVVMPRGGDLQRAPRLGLAAHVREVHLERPGPLLEERGGIHALALERRLAPQVRDDLCERPAREQDRKSTRLNSSHVKISY